MSVKNVTPYSKTFFAFLKVFKLLSMCVEVQVNKEQLSIHKKSVMGVISLPPHVRDYQVKIR